jgi:hypothetical protein
MMENLLGD